MKVEIRQNVIDALVKLRDKDARRVINEALNTSVRILRKETVQNFKRGVTKYGKKINMKTAGLVRVGRGARKQLIKKVHIMGLPLARIFEKGTDERETQVRRKLYTSSYTDSRGERHRYTIGRGKGRRTGRITPVYFFRDARNEKEEEIYRTFNRQLLVAFRKLWKAGKIQRK